MRDVTNDPLDLAGIDDADEWRALIEDISEERGYFELLGNDHAALFTEGGDVLLVSFENAEALRAERPDRQPLGWVLTERNHWSSLVLLSEGHTWFRDAEIYAYFDRLLDDGFFDEFEHVVFLGAGPEGYAAAAFSVVAPEATVIAFAPQATLRPELAVWDRRFLKARKLDFTSRFGYAPHMIEAAGATFVIHDPTIPEDAMHAALYAASGAQLIRARHFGPDPSALFEETGALQRMVEAAVAGKLNPSFLYQLMRRRRDSSAYLRALLRAVEAHRAPHLAIMLCNYVLERTPGPKFRKALARAEKALAERNASTARNDPDR